MDLSSKIECLTHSKILCMLLIMIWGRMSLIHPLVRLQSPKIYCWKETLFVFGVILSMLPPKGPNKNLVPLYHETHAVPRLVVHCCLNDAQMPMMHSCQCQWCSNPPTLLPTLLTSPMVTLFFQISQNGDKTNPGKKVTKNSWMDTQYLIHKILSHAL